MDARIQSSVVTQLSRRPRTVEVGPFVIGWDPSTPSRFINYATPVPDAAITATDVSALVTAFGDIERVPRLEYVLSAAPALEELLLAASFTVEARHDYLICTPDSLAVPNGPDSAAGPDAITVAPPATDEERAALLAAQNEAFGGEPTATEADVARIRRTQDSGGVVILARTAAGEVVGGGAAPAPSGGVSEVAGIAVREPFRRRGIAGAITAAITQRLFAAGADCAWLEASGEDSWRVYERVGYAATGKRLYIALD